MTQIAGYTTAGSLWSVDAPIHSTPSTVITVGAAFASLPNLWTGAFFATIAAAYPTFPKT